MRSLLLIIGAAAGALWLWCLLSLGFGVQRLTRRAEARLQLRPQPAYAARRSGWMPFVRDSVLLMVNIVLVLVRSACRWPSGKSRTSGTGVGS